MNYNFFDLNPQFLPNNAQYYFNVLVIDIVASAAFANTEKIKLQDYWDLTHILDARPYVYHIQFDRTIPKDQQLLDLIPHSVIEIAQNEVSWFPMLSEDDSEGYSEEDYLNELQYFGADGYTGDEDWWSFDGATLC